MKGLVTESLEKDNLANFKRLHNNFKRLHNSLHKISYFLLVKCSIKPS